MPPRALGDGLVDGLGVMGHAAEEHTVGGKFARSQLGVFFDEKAVVVERHLEKLGQLFVGIGTMAAARVSRSGLISTGSPSTWSVTRPLTDPVADNLGLVFQIVADEDHTPHGLSCRAYSRSP
jgi:hypothetical protein